MVVLGVYFDSLFVFLFNNFVSVLFVMVVLLLLLAVDLLRVFCLVRNVGCFVDFAVWFGCGGCLVI